MHVLSGALNGKPVSSGTSLQRWVILAIAVLWIGAGVLLAIAMCRDFPALLTRTLAAVVGSGVLIVVLHIGILRLFTSRKACIGLVVGKVCALPFTSGFGLFGLALLAMSTDGGMEAGAEIAYQTIPFGMAVTAVPALTGAFIGAAVGQQIDRRRG